MSAIRGLQIIPRLASGQSAFAARSTVPSGARRAAFSLSAPRFKSEVIKEKEVPVSVYNPDVKGVASGSSVHYSIPVTPQQTPVETIEDKISPLKDDVFKSLPPTIQKMTVKDKVIIVTG
jgi:hypothetical protein